MFDDRPEHSGTPPGVAPGVSPNATPKSIDSGDFLAGKIRPGVATAVRDSGVGGQQDTHVGLLRGCGV